MMHLVMLREQLVPFERPFTVAETSLDFTPLSGLIVWFGHALTSVPHSDAWNRVKQDRFRSFVTVRLVSPRHHLFFRTRQGAFSRLWRVPHRD